MPSSVITATAAEPQLIHAKPAQQEKSGTEQASLPADDGDEYTRFFWTYTEEPHRTRRQAIIKAHPEVRIPTKPHGATHQTDAICRSSSSAGPSP